MPRDSIAGLKSLGPASARVLAAAGILSVDQLRELGAVAAFVQVRKVDPRASLNLLWALESALTGEPWQSVARHHRTSLLLAVDDLERSLNERAQFLSSVSMR